MIIRSTGELRKRFQELRTGDVFVGNLALRPGEEFKAIDLLHRGILVFPSLQSQFLSRSKVFQAEVLGPFMLKHTFVAYKNRDLVRCLPDYAGYGQIVCKRDRKHLGLGISRWNCLEDLQSLAAMEALPYPLVIQPFLRDARDIRVLIIDDYSEAYEKTNHYSFRKNLAYGGKSKAIEISSKLDTFCKKVMARGDFPYAVLDILMDRSDNCYLSEINLSAGLTGSSIGQDEFITRKIHVHDRFCQSLNSRQL